MNEDWRIEECRRYVATARQSADEVGIPVERYDSGLNVPQAEYLLTAVEELRAVLAPLLDDPTYDGDGMSGAYIACKFCPALLFWNQDVSTFTHAADCPVLPPNRDRLLGRAKVEATE